MKIRLPSSFLHPLIMMTIFFSSCVGAQSWVFITKMNNSDDLYLNTSSFVVKGVEVQYTYMINYAKGPDYVPGDSLDSALHTKSGLYTQISDCNTNQYLYVKAIFFEGPNASGSVAGLGTTLDKKWLNASAGTISEILQGQACARVNGPFKGELSAFDLTDTELQFYSNGFLNIYECIAPENKSGSPLYAFKNNGDFVLISVARDGKSLSTRRLDEYYNGKPWSRLTKAVPYALESFSQDKNRVIWTRGDKSKLYYSKSEFYIDERDDKPILITETRLGKDGVNTKKRVIKCNDFKSTSQGFTRKNIEEYNKRVSIDFEFLKDYFGINNKPTTP